jgi:hypothetical protein
MVSPSRTADAAEFCPRRTVEESVLVEKSNKKRNFEVMGILGLAIILTSKINDIILPTTINDGGLAKKKVNWG